MVQPPQETSSPASESPVPSFTLQITRRDAERFIEASQALMSTLEEMQKDNPNETLRATTTTKVKQEESAELASSKAKETEASAGEVSDSGDKEETKKAIEQNKPLHETLSDAAQKCQHPFISSFMDRIHSVASLPRQEADLAVLLFHDSDKSTKLRHFFAAISKETSRLALDRSGALSLFRSILLALSCCVHTPNTDASHKVVVEGKPDSTTNAARNMSQASPTGEPPTKKVKREEETASTTKMTEISGDLRAHHSHSFDSSLATLRDEEDEHQLRKEVDEIAAFAVEQLGRFVRKQKKDGEGSTMIEFATFGDWYNADGKEIVPWLELLQLSKWKTSPQKQPTVTAASPSTTASNNAKPITSNPTEEPAPEKHSKPEHDKDEPSPCSLTNEDDSSRVVVSFDFSGSASPNLLVKITEDNIYALRNVVHRSNLAQRQVGEVCKYLLRNASRRWSNGHTELIFQRDSFPAIMDNLILPFTTRQLSPQEHDSVIEALCYFFSCFDHKRNGEINAKDFAVGFCFLCAGNKSSKLAIGVEVMDDKRVGYLTEKQLLRYLRSYLTMLVAVSLLVPMGRQQRLGLTPERQRAVLAAVDNGAKWTLGHYLKSLDHTHMRNGYTFDSFASWYSAGGYSVVPWLELLDLNKLFSLINDASSPVVPVTFPPAPVGNPCVTTERRPQRRDRVSTLRRHHSSRRGPPPEVLFTFPLANRRSLVVLKEDAMYVRGVVEQLSLLSTTPDELWSSLLHAVEKRGKSSQEQDAAIYVDMATFVQSMREVHSSYNRNYATSRRSGYDTSASTEELLSNFFQCFDIDQLDRVALDELMGGLTLLCGGKKSTKLAFAFSVFDTRPGVHHRKARSSSFTHSLSGEDLFLFLRSILIITFSCCGQSLDMSDELVSQCIADTANMICNDVMRHQWERKQMDRLDFDDFGKWYNDGGYERAPWLELLDLRKWVLVESFDKMEKKAPPPRRKHEPASAPIIPALPAIPPPPPEDALDSSFFDENAIMPIDSMDEMDMILMQNSSDKEIDEPIPKLTKSFSFSPGNKPTGRQASPLKFHLSTDDAHGGYMLSMSQTRISHLRRILEETSFHQQDAESFSNLILQNSSGSRLTFEGFEISVRQVIAKADGRKSRKPSIPEVFKNIFSAFDYERSGQVNAVELACGITLLCKGKKSDKLEFAFDVLDKNKLGRLSKDDVTSYLRSFLRVLLAIACSPSLDNDSIDDTVTTMKGESCDRTPATVNRIGKVAAEWAASLALRDFEVSPPNQTAISFDNFAEWYTGTGYGSIPWLELLDLHKWVLTHD